jgi:hypothetical protein
MTNLELRARTSPRNITVELDPIDAIFVVAALAEEEARYSALGLFPTRERRVRNVRVAIERAVYGDPAGSEWLASHDDVTETELRAQWGDR